MAKLIFLLRRKSGTTREQCLSYWASGAHAALVEKLPGLERWVRNGVTGGPGGAGRGIRPRTQSTAERAWISHQSGRTSRTARAASSSCPHRSRPQPWACARARWITISMAMSKIPSNGA